MDTIAHVENELKKGVIAPHFLADHKAKLAADYSFYAGQLEAIQVRKPKVWLELRKDNKSDTSTDRAYELTEDGTNEIGLEWKLKRIGKLIQALNSLLQVAEGEARNSF